MMSYPKYKCIKSFLIQGRKGDFVVNEGEIWELRDSFEGLFARNKVGILLAPWQIECFELAESEEEE